jgi:hypothetical protein
LINDVWQLHEIPIGDIIKPGLLITSKSDERTQIQVFTNEKSNIQIDNSEENKASCAKVCKRSEDENTCKLANDKRKKCCKLVEKNNCPPGENKCCRVRCEIFKNKEACELQNNAENLRCCFTVRSKCESSVFKGDKFVCGEKEDDEED